MRWLLTVACTLALGCGPNIAPVTELRLLTLGDSFTIGTSQPPSQNFPSQLVRLLEARGHAVRLTNPAVNGYSTANLIRSELPLLDTARPTDVTLAVGANDLVRESDPDLYRARLDEIFGRLSRAGVAGQTWALPQPDWSASPVAASFGDPAQLHARIEAYNDILSAEATAAGAHYLDLWPLMEEQAKQALIADDGLHPTGEAYAEWARRLADAIAPERAK